VNFGTVVESLVAVGNAVSDKVIAVAEAREQVVAFIADVILEAAGALA
jgi:hypothetical protein